MELLSEHRCFGGIQRFYKHEAQAIGLPMRFSVYLPPQAERGPVPALFYLAGLTCNEETFMTKAGAQRMAAALGMMLIAPDTSPRGAGIPGEADEWDFGVAAGFYLDATMEPWARRYRMDSYILELAALVRREFPVAEGKLGIMGHSMGGHGALVLGLRNPDVFGTVSALAPICAPSECPWGAKAFSRYLGEDRAQWARYDATRLIESGARAEGGLLIDQGTADKFLAEQLHPERFKAACEQAGQALRLRMHDGYDHGYYFIQSVIEDHLRFHHGGGALPAQ
ncbi:MAG TPA: S-formylglutathione hydrolase [Burkholderiaceae bacterium]